MFILMAYKFGVFFNTVNSKFQLIIVSKFTLTCAKPFKYLNIKISLILTLVLKDHMLIWTINNSFISAYSLLFILCLFQSSLKTDMI